jgi:hypothetical protein
MTDNNEKIIHPLTKEEGDKQERQLYIICNNKGEMLYFIEDYYVFLSPVDPRNNQPYTHRFQLFDRNEMIRFFTKTVLPILTMDERTKYSYHVMQYELCIEQFWKEIPKDEVEDLLDFDQDDPANIPHYPVRPARSFRKSFGNYFLRPLKLSFRPIVTLLIILACLAILTGFNYLLLIIFNIICSTVAGILFLNGVSHYFTHRTLDNYIMKFGLYLKKQELKSDQINAARK